MISKRAAAPYPPSNTAPAPTLLVVDRDVDVANQLASRLRGTGIRILRASTGMQGYWLAISKAPQAIVTDLGMSNGGGADMLECLKDSAETESIPVVVHTAQAYPGMQRHLERLGASAIVTKTPQLDNLMGILGQLLAAA